MRHLGLIALTAIGISACQETENAAVQSPPGTAPPTGLQEGWSILFSGQDLDSFNRIGDANWQLIDDYVEADEGKASFLVTRDSFGDFQMQLEFWPSPDANSGVFFRCKDSTLISNETCYELNIYDQHAKPDNATGSIINLAPPRVSIKAGNRWNTYDITAQGSHIVVRLNNTVVVDFQDESFVRGPIGLQSNGGLIRFRNVKVRSL